MAQKDRKRQQKKRQDKIAKRKNKLSQRKAISANSGTHAYHGNKYKNAKHVELIVTTESGICFAYLASDRRLTDDLVVFEIEQLITDIRHGKIDDLLDDRPPVLEDQLDGITTWGILSYWDKDFEVNGVPSRDDLIGILRTLLGSISTRTGPGSKQRGYLQYVEKFLTDEIGVAFNIEQDLADQSQYDEESDEIDELDELDDELLALGQRWQESSLRQARIDFETEANHRILAGRGCDVVEICLELLDETDNGMIVKRLQSILTEASSQSSSSQSPPD